MSRMARLESTKRFSPLEQDETERIVEHSPRLQHEKPTRNKRAEKSAAEILGSLTPQQAEVLRLRAMEGLPHLEIGKILWPDIHPELARARSTNTYKRALRKIRTLTTAPDESMLAAMSARSRGQTLRHARKRIANNLGPELAQVVLQELQSKRPIASATASKAR